MATVRVNPEKLSDAVDKIMEEYFDGVESESLKAVAEVAAEAAAELQTQSETPRNTGKYAKGWRVKKDKSKSKNEVTIYNTQYQLTHLLEYGHVKVAGGRVLGFTDAKPHIAGVERKAINKLTKRIKEAAQE